MNPRALSAGERRVGQSNIVSNEMILMKSCLHGRSSLGRVDEKREAGMAFESWRRRCCGLSRGTKSE
jgi:hypothetical protein